MDTKRVFILEWKPREPSRRGDKGYVQTISDCLIDEIGDKFKLEITGSNSKTEYIRHLPENYDWYFLHLSHTELEAIRELRENQSWSKIFLRTSMGNELPAEFKLFSDGQYKINPNLGTPSIKEIIRSLQ